MRNLIVLFSVCAFAFAQPQRPDARGCQDPSILSRMTGCTILRCEQKDYNIFKMPIGKPNKFQDVEGAFEKVGYVCPAGVSGLQTFRNAENALKGKGYQVVYTDNYSNVRFTLTAKQGEQWVSVYSAGVEYTVTAVKQKQMEQQMQANTADGWGEQIRQTGRVSIYGINFDTGKATIRPDSESVLNEVLLLLQKEPEWYMLVAGHTDSVGSDAVNTPLSRQRAEAVVAWLTAKGVDRSRLIAAGFGPKKPVADNDSEEGRAKNRRVDLVKLY
jgi:outer membrane protein OmpA-like peptidoglycan-associated protein